MCMLSLDRICGFRTVYVLILVNLWKQQSSSSRLLTLILSLSSPQLFLSLKCEQIQSTFSELFRGKVTWFLQLVHDFPFGQNNLYLIVPQWIFDAQVPLSNCCGCFENLWLHTLWELFHSAGVLGFTSIIPERMIHGKAYQKINLSHFEVGFPCCWAPELDVAESVYFWEGHLLILCIAFL